MSTSRVTIMTKHTHSFVEMYKGLVGFGYDRQTDENTIMYYLQKFSDDAVMKKIINKMSDDELSEIFSLITQALKTYFSESDYHKLFLKD
jgi:peptide methionine sulfoxide reductase MsrA